MDRDRNEALASLGPDVRRGADVLSSRQLLLQVLPHLLEHGGYPLGEGGLGEHSQVGAEGLDQVQELGALNG